MHIYLAFHLLLEIGGNRVGNRWSLLFPCSIFQRADVWSATRPMHNVPLWFLLLAEPEGSLGCVLGRLISVMNYKRECSPQALGRQWGSSTPDSLRAVIAAGLPEARHYKGQRATHIQDDLLFTSCFSKYLL